MRTGEERQGGGSYTSHAAGPSNTPGSSAASNQPYKTNIPRSWMSMSADGSSVVIQIPKELFIRKTPTPKSTAIEVAKTVEPSVEAKGKDKKSELYFVF